MKRMLGGRAAGKRTRGNADKAAAAKLLWRKLRREITRAIVPLPEGQKTQGTQNMQPECPRPAFSRCHQRIPYPLSSVPVLLSSCMPTPSDHFDGLRYFNPSGANGQPFWKLPRLLATPKTRWPSEVQVQPRRPPILGEPEIVVTFVGHSTFLIQTAGINVLIDPVYADRASPLSFAGPRRARLPGVRFDDLPPTSLVLLSHNHYDHCDLGTLRRLEQRFHPMAVTPPGNGRLLRAAGFSKIEERDWWQTSRTAPVRVTVTPAQHFSARTLFDRNRALWGGFLIETGGRRVYHTGDSGYGPHFRVISARLGPINLALIPIGAYEPRWFMR